MYPGSGDTIYAFQGNTTANFWAYSISNNSWTAQANAPLAVFRGGALTATGDTRILYGFISNTSADFWAYRISPSPYAGPNWYVNDNATANDSFTTVIGANTGDGSPANPFLSIDSALARVSAGETIFIDAGMYTPGDTLTIDTNGIFMIGVDSALTVIDFNNTAQAAARAIYATGRQNLTLRNFAVTRAYHGIWWDNVDNSSITGIRSDTHGQNGIWLDNGASGNTLTSNASTGNSGRGIYLLSSSNNNTLTSNTNSGNTSGGILLNTNSNNNTLTSNTNSGNSSDGISLNGSSSNTLTSNTSSGNSSNGIFLFNSSDNNTLTSNTSSGNSSNGIFLSTFSDNNTLTQNTVDSNALWGFRIAGMTAADTFHKNVIIGGVANPDSGVFNEATSGFAFDFTRNWFGTTDTASIRNMIGGTTEAHRDSIIFSPYRLGIVDTAVGADTVAPNAPDTVAVAVGDDTTLVVSWAVSAGSEESEGAANLTGHRVWRTTGADSASQGALTAVATVGAGVTQIIDSGLSFFDTYYYRVTAFDNNVTENQSFFSDSIVSEKPRWLGPIWYVNDTATAGDAFTTGLGADTGSGSPARPFLRIDSALALVSAGETVMIDAGTYNPSDTLTIDTNGIFIIGVDSALTVIDFNSTTGAAARAIYATGRTNLTLRDFTIRRGYNGIWWDNVDTSTIERVRSDTHGLNGIGLSNGSSGNTLTSNASSGNTNIGILIQASSNNTLTSNTSSGNSDRGIWLFNSSNTTLTSNTSSGNFGQGILLESSSNNTLTSNTIFGNSNRGIYIFNSSNNNTLTSNSSSGNLISGIDLESSSNNTLTQNTVDSNASWGFQVTGTSSADTFSKNVIIGGVANPDSGVFNAATSGFAFDFTRNWWSEPDGQGTTDTAAIRNKIGGTSEAHRDSIIFSPYRLGIVDTAVGADTVAPNAPDTVAASRTTDTLAVVTWRASAGSEEPETAANLNGYRVWRALTRDSAVAGDAVAAGTLAAGTETFTDSGLVLGQRYWYRVTAFDNHAFRNESFFSDSIIEVSDVPPYNGPIWYVNDTATAGDSFTQVIGADTGNGSFTAPFLSVDSAAARVSAGETVLIDAGTFTPADSITVPGNSVFIIGVDSALTVIDFVNQAANNGIRAVGRSFVTVQDLAVIRGAIGVSLDGTSQSNIIRVRSDANSQQGISLVNNSDTNLISRTTVSGNLQGMRLTGGSANNTIESSAATASATQDGFELSGASRNLLYGNTASGNARQGFRIEAGSANNTLTGNTASGNTSQGILVDGSSNNILRSNVISRNAAAGLLITGSSNNLIVHNTIDSNAAWAVDISGASSADTVFKNILITGAGVQDQGIRNQTAATYDALRNVWMRAGTLTTDSAIIAGMTSNTGGGTVVYTPFRLGIVDTAVGADTVAPRAPVMDTAVGFETGVEIRWNQVTVDEDGSALSGFAGYRIYRTTNAATTNWKGETVIATIANPATIFYADTSVLGGIFYYTMTAVDNQNPENESFFSDSVIQVILGPTKPILVNPADTATTADTLPVFQWTGTNTDTFTLQVASDSSFNTIVGFTLTDSVTFAARLATGLDSGTYFWRMLAASSISPVTETSAVRQLTIDTVLVDTIPPEAFNLVSPADASETNVTVVRFQWDLTTDTWSGVGSYVLQADTSPTFGTPKAATTVGPTQNSATLTLFGPDQLWYWRVLAVDKAGRTRISGPRTLTIDTLVTVSLVAPDSGVTQDSRPVFQWSGVSADTYRLQVDSSTLFTGAMDIDVETTATSLQPAGLDSGTYHWRVIGTDALGNSATTDTRILHVNVGSGATDNTPPLSFGLVSPATGHETSAGSGVAFSWQATTDTGAGLKEYVLEISRSAAFANVDAAETVSATTTSAAVALVGNDTYYWRVKAIDLAPSVNVRLSSETRVVFVDTGVPGAPVPVAPTGGVETTVTSVSFVWNASTEIGFGLAGYRLQFSTTPGIGADTVEVFDTGTSADTPTASTMPNLLFSAADTWYWRIRAEDRAGNTSPWSAVDSFTRPAPTETLPPLPVQDLRATALETTSVRLDWNRSPSNDVTQYHVFWNAGIGLTSPDTFLTSVTHFGDAHSFVTGVLEQGAEYRFNVFAQDTAGNRSEASFVSAVARTGAATVGNAKLVFPRTGSKLRSGDTLVSLTMAIGGTPAQIAAVSTIRFQTRIKGGLGWVDMTPAPPSTNPLPGTAIDELGNVTFNWNPGALIPDEYEFRFVVTSTNGDTSSEEGSGASMKIVDPAVDTPSFTIDVTDTAKIVTLQLHVNRSETIVVRNNPETQTGMVFIPAGSFPSATDTQEVFVIVEMNVRSDFDTQLPSTMNTAFDVLDVRLSNGDTALANNQSAIVTLTFFDADGDGFVDGTRVPWSTLRLFHHSGKQGGTWEERGTTERQNPTAANNGVGWLRTTTTRFSLFRLVGNAVSNSLSNFFIAPNPFRPNDGNATTGQAFTGAAGTGIFFFGLPQSVRIEIYTVTGERVFDRSFPASTGQIQWDVRNEANRDVASGYYLYVVTDQATGERRSGKLAVIR